MIQAFDAIASAGPNGGDQKLLTATGISQALITTAAGMTVAIPALIAYLFFSSRVDKHVMEIDSLGMKVVNQISAEALHANQSTVSSSSGSSAARNRKAA
jgi:biopolymer transport protein ExbB